MRCAPRPNRGATTTPRRSRRTPASSGSCSGGPRRAPARSPKRAAEMANIDPQMLAGSLRRLSGAADQDIAVAVDEVVRAGVVVLRVSGSGLMIADEQSNLHYIASSDGPSHILEEVQSSTGQGPCV